MKSVLGETIVGYVVLENRLVRAGTGENPANEAGNCVRRLATGSGMPEVASVSYPQHVMP